MKSLRAYISEHHTTQTAVAKKLGVDRFVISKWLSGTRKPSNRYVWKIARITNKNFLEILREIGQ